MKISDVLLKHLIRLGYLIFGFGNYKRGTLYVEIRGEMMRKGLKREGKKDSFGKVALIFSYLRKKKKHLDSLLAKPTLCPPEGTVYAREGTVCSREGTVCPREGAVYAQEPTVCSREDTVCPRERAVYAQEPTVCLREDTVCQREGAVYAQEPTVCLREDTVCSQGLTVCPRGDTVDGNGVEIFCYTEGKGGDIGGQEKMGLNREIK